ncbi:MAG: glycosyltransferase family 2 protein [Bacteroidales bacterium]|nr:glycosyltransferase family 2 protein [Bacteroidales bacterium]
MKNSSSPLVSICVPTYNRAGLISVLLDSILAQSYNNFEIIITDNSDDMETKELISLKYNDKRIQYYKNKKNLGMDGNTLKVLSLITGKYFTFTPDDDIWIDPQKLEKQISLLENNEYINCCFSNVKHIHQNGTLHPEQFIYKNNNKMGCDIINSTSLLLTGKPTEFVCILTGVIRSSMLELFRESWRYGSEEYFMWYIGGTGQQIGFCYENLISIRDGEHNWQISDSTGGLVNYKFNQKRRASQLIDKYVNLVENHSSTLKYFGVNTEIVVFKLLIKLIGEEAFRYKNKFSKLSTMDFAYLYGYYWLYSLKKYAG